MITPNSITIARLIAGWFFTAAPMFCISTALPLLALEQGAGAYAASALGSVCWAGMLLAAASTPSALKTLQPVSLNRMTAAAFPLGCLLCLLSRDVLVTGMVGVALGYCAGVRWVISDSWIAELGADKLGRIVGTYEAASGSTLFVGPALAAASLTAPMALFSSCALFGLVALCCVWNLVPPSTRSHSVEHRQVGWIVSGLNHSTIFVAAAIGGMFEGGAAAPLSVWLTLYSEANPAVAASLVTWIGIGSFLCQIPLGLATERFGVMQVQRWSAALLPFGALMLLVAGHSLLVVGLVALVWGGIGGGLYTLSTIELGLRRRGAALIGGMSAMAVAYNIGSSVGPILGGVALEIQPEIGLPAFFGGVAVLVSALLFARGMKSSIDNEEAPA